MNCVGLLWKLIHADNMGWGDNSFTDLKLSLANSKQLTLNH